MTHKIFFIVAIIYVCQHSLPAQNLSDSLYLKRPTGNFYFQHGKKITFPNLARIIKESPTAHEEYKKAQTSRFFSTIIGGVGSGFLGSTISSLIFGEGPYWTFAGIGAGLVVIAIPLSSADRMHTREAVRLYNAGLK